ncbi:ribulose-1,5 bisphosphate carboxylase/oxygenase large subunit N-methyltransferase, chloroplastic-like isoform X1 [Coffea arabica]|uniref:Ribulose-1,5 bisphosphate carboxylase/oxygenase large subunit N-methyltransferase, chloroplastic-like isoform X1 n=2 Tax=Coffea arabica TaxID=13443 RepID=A0ABM4UP33_COFAR
MEVNQAYISPNTAETDDEISFVLDLSENDPLFQKKKKLLEDVGFDPKGSVALNIASNPDHLKHVLDMMLKCARVINLNEIELYFGGADFSNLVDFNSPRNELEALHSVLRLIDCSISNGKVKNKNSLQEIRNATVNMIDELGHKYGEETKVVQDSSCEKEQCLLQWGKSNGLHTKLEIAYVEGAGRGAIAKEDLKIGDIALEVPVSLVISENLVFETDMFPILEKIEGISSETMLLLWSMKEKHNSNSNFKLYFDTLPAVFNTGLSFGVNAIMALDGTILLEEIVQAKEHLRNQYEQLFPVLYENYPDVFPPELYTWEQFLWACELWYSNSMKIMFSDGKLRTCLIPVAGFLNHSTCPHITHYGKVDPLTDSVKFPLSRPCNAGEQCFLTYGNFSSSHLLTFYGFLPRQKNPYDVIPLDIDIAQDEDCEDAGRMSDWDSHMVRGTWFSRNNGIFNYGLAPPLLDHFRRARGPISRTKTHDSLEIEVEILNDLRSTFEGMMESLGGEELDDRDSCSWDVKLAMDFKDLQRRIVSSIITSCDAGCKLLEYELSRCSE